MDARPATVLEHAAGQASMPEWVEISAGWWAEGALDDGAFLQSIQYLIDRGIIQIPATESGGDEGAGKMPTLGGSAPGGGPKAPLMMTTHSYSPSSSSYRMGSWLPLNPNDGDGRAVPSLWMCCSYDLIPPGRLPSKCLAVGKPTLNNSSLQSLQSTTLSTLVPACLPACLRLEPP